VQAIGRVGIEILEARHLPDFGRNPDEAASVEGEALNGFQFCDRARKRDDLRLVAGHELVERRKRLNVLEGGCLNQFEQPLPSVAVGVLLLNVQADLADVSLKAPVLSGILPRMAFLPNARLCNEAVARDPFHRR
jgi:hypothetical protein